MEEKQVREWVNKHKWEKLAKHAIRGEELSSLTKAERITVAFFAADVLMKGIQRALSAEKSLIPDSFNEELKQIDYEKNKIPFTLENQKYVIVLYKILNIIEATKILGDAILAYEGEYLKIKDDFMKQINQRDALIAIGLKNAIKSVIMNDFIPIGNQIEEILEKGLAFSQANKEEAKMLAGSVATSNMQKYINNMNKVLMVVE